MKLSFLGAARQVTGSCYCLQVGSRNVLVDHGLFQERAFLQRNWNPCPVPAASLHAVLLTHAHLDHSGLLPRLVREGFNGPIWATPATIDLVRLVLEDSARLQEEDVAFKQERHQREGRRSPHPYEPLYRPADVQQTMRLFRPVPYGTPIAVGDHIRVTWHDAGHILGSAMLEIDARENGANRRIVFSGDLGQFNTPIIRDPTLLESADFVVMESTYGDRTHDHSRAIEDQLARVIHDTVDRGGNVVVPTFAIERAQEILFHLSRLLCAGRIPHVLVFLDSPMAASATDVFRKHAGEFDQETRDLMAGDCPPFGFEGMVLSRSVQQSKAINHVRGSCVILAGSGMCTDGRIKHHLVQNITKPESTVLFVGYQANGTLGRLILDGTSPVRILGASLEVKARVEQIQGMSAHADRPGLLRWLAAFKKPPRQAFLTHGEESGAMALAQTIRSDRGIDVSVPEYRQAVELA